MADAIETNIVINAIGGDGAAAQIDQVNSGFKALETEHGNLQKRFTEKFEHVGLRIFAGQAIQTAGLAGEMRPILSTLMLTMNSVGAAFGAASGPILLVVAALAAVVGVVSRVSAAQKDHADAIDKAIAANEKQLESVNKTIDGLDKLTATGGHLTIAQKELMASSTALAAVIRDQQITAINEHIKVLEASRAKIVAHAQTISQWHSFVQEASSGWKAFVEQLKIAMTPFEGLYSILQKVTGATADWTKAMTGTASLKMSAEDTNKLNLELAKNDVALKQAKADLESLKAGYTGLGDTAIAAQQKELEGRKKVSQEMKKIIDDQHAAERKAMDDRMNYWIKQHQDQIKQAAKYAVDEKKITETLTSDISSSWAQAFDDMIFKGKDFVEAFGEAFQKMTEQIIMDIIRMEIEWAVFTALRSAGGGGIPIGMMAEGGTMVVDKPTLFIAGEAGPEIASFTPLSKAGSSGGSGGGGGGGGSGGPTTVNISIQTQSISEGDVPMILNRMSDEIRRETDSGRRFSLTVNGIATRNVTRNY